MLNTPKIKSLYSKIQTELFYLIPEKWDRIYLYAAVIEKINHLETGEMFFYYFPTGFLKKNPVNVYEIPSKFNIDEDAYMKLVNQLYETIQLLRKEFEKAGEKLWTNLTISIENLKFKVEYNYENLEKSNYSDYDRHIIWQYKYLNLPIERLSKKDRTMLEEYLIQERFKNTDTEKHTESMYQKNVHNIVEYNKVESSYQEEYEENNKKEFKQAKDKRKEDSPLDKYELYKRKKEEEKKEEKKQELLSTIDNKEENKRNQILNF